MNRPNSWERAEERNFRLKVVPVFDSEESVIQIKEEILRHCDGVYAVYINNDRFIRCKHCYQYIRATEYDKDGCPKCCDGAVAAWEKENEGLAAQALTEGTNDSQ